MHSETISSIMAINFQLHQSTPFTKWQRMLCLLIGIIEDAWPYGRGTLFKTQQIIKQFLLNRPGNDESPYEKKHTYGSFLLMRSFDKIKRDTGSNYKTNRARRERGIRWRGSLWSSTSFHNSESGKFTCANATSDLFLSASSSSSSLSSHVTPTRLYKITRISLCFDD